jgi:hypothetical protein
MRGGNKVNITAHRLFLTDYCRSLGERRAAEVERNFFASLQLRNGTTKQTEANRLSDVNDATSSYFKRLVPPPEDFLDVGVSSGISTGEWHADLRRAGFKNIRVTGTDLTLHAYLVELNGFFRVLVQQCNFPLQYDVGGIPISAARYGRRGYLDGTYLAAWLLRRLFQRISAKHRLPSRLLGNTAGLLADEQRIRITGLQLISPSVAERGSVNFIDDDLSAANDPSLIARFDVIRAANILNLVYFTENDLILFLNRLKERLKGPNASLLICRTRQPGDNDATLFRLSPDGRFEVVLRVGSGSEIEAVVLAIR